jgi:hypothetical protein
VIGCPFFSVPFLWARKEKEHKKTRTIAHKKSGMLSHPATFLTTLFAFLQRL